MRIVVIQGWKILPTPIPFVPRWQFHFQGDDEFDPIDKLTIVAMDTISNWMFMETYWIVQFPMVSSRWCMVHEGEISWRYLPCYCQSVQRSYQSWVGNLMEMLATYLPICAEKLLMAHGSCGGNSWRCSLHYCQSVQRIWGCGSWIMKRTTHESA